MTILDVKLLDDLDEAADDIGQAKYVGFVVVWDKVKLNFPLIICLVTGKSIYVINIQNGSNLRFLKNQLKRSEITYFTMTADLDGRLLSSLRLLPDTFTGDSHMQDLPTVDFLIRIRKFVIQNAASNTKYTVSSLAKIGDRKLSHKNLLQYWLGTDINPELNEEELAVIRDNLDYILETREFPHQVEYALRKVCTHIRPLGLSLLRGMVDPIDEICHHIFLSAAKATDKERNDYEYHGDSYLDFTDWATSLKGDESDFNRLYDFATDV